jgi:xanthine dehydrogenase YagS FAD-binding subunit
VRPFEYESAATVEEVTALLGEHGRDGNGATRPLAGGTDLLTLMKADVATPTRLIDIKRVSSLGGGVESGAQGLRLGALTTLAEIETSRAIEDGYPALAEAAAQAATPQLRNMATIGGNLLQRPRCWYFRGSHFRCWLKGGDDCPARDGENQLHAIFGDGPCCAVHPSDLASPLVAFDAEVDLQGASGRRTLSIADFFATPADDRRTETALRGDELLVSVRIPPLSPGTGSTYLKAMDRKVWAFALVGVAAALKVDGPRIEDARIVLSGVANVPWRAHEAEQELVGGEVSDQLFARVAGTALAGAAPLGRNGYKVPLARNLVRRALTSLAGDA